MYQFFSRNSYLSFFALPLLLLLYRVRLLATDSISQAAADVDLYTPIWQETFGRYAQSGLVADLIAILAAYVLTLIVNHISNSFRFAGGQTNLGGMFFIIMSSGFIVTQSLHPASIFAIFFFLALHRVFKAASLEIPPMRHSYDASLLLALGTLFWAKGFLFYGFFIVLLFVIRIMSFRVFIASLLGWLTPFAIVATYYFCTDQISEMAITYWRQTFIPVAFYKTGVFSKVYIIFGILFILVSIMRTLQNLSMLKIVESNIMRAVVWCVIFFAVLIMFPHFSFEMLAMVTAAAALLAAPWVQQIRSRIKREILVAFFAIYSFIVQLIV